MNGRRQDREQQRRREALERAMGLPEPVEAALCFHDHADLVRGLAESLERAGLPEACQALARHMEEDRDHWLRRLERIEAEPALRARRTELDRDYLELFTGHFGRWGAAGAQGERIAQMEAGLLLAALRGAERLWVQGRGRPMLPVLVQEAVALLWPALYGHARRHLPK
jgi:hypothetical protein